MRTFMAGLLLFGGSIFLKPCNERKANHEPIEPAKLTPKPSQSALVQQRVLSFLQKNPKPEQALKQLCPSEKYENVSSCLENASTDKSLILYYNALNRNQPAEALSILNTFIFERNIRYDVVLKAWQDVVSLLGPEEREEAFENALKKNETLFRKIALSITTESDNFEPAFRACVKACSSLPDSFREKTKIIMRKGRIAQAREIAHAALARFPEEAVTHEMAGLTDLSVKEVEEGLEHLKKALVLYSRQKQKISSGFYYNLAYAYVVNLDAQSAELYLRKSLDMNPENERAISLLMNLMERKGNFQDYQQLRKRLEKLRNSS